MAEEVIVKRVFPEIHSFQLSMKYKETDRRSHIFEIDMHSHAECELIVNLSGDVSFMVENDLYPMTRGDVILIRPGVYHHCVYRSDARHRFYWILISGSGNEQLFDFFFGEKSANYISPDRDARKEIIRICSEVIENDTADTELYHRFFQLLHILRSNAAEASHANTLPADLSQALAYIDDHIDRELRLSDLERHLYLSTSTITRRFQKYLHMHPSDYIRRKKLHLATQLLLSGDSVLSAAMKVGYLDTSHFIKLFRQYYGVTPLQYKKANLPCESENNRVFP